MVCLETSEGEEQQPQDTATLKIQQPITFKTGRQKVPKGFGHTVKSNVQDFEPQLCLESDCSPTRIRHNPNESHWLISLRWVECWNQQQDMKSSCKSGFPRPNLAGTLTMVSDSPWWISSSRRLLRLLWKPCTRRTCDRRWEPRCLACQVAFPQSFDPKRGRPKFWKAKIKPKSHGSMVIPTSLQG